MTLTLGVMNVVIRGAVVAKPKTNIPFSQGGLAPLYLLANNPSGPNQIQFLDYIPLPFPVWLGGQQPT